MPDVKQSPTFGAARTYTESVLGGPCNEQDSTPSVNTTAVEIAKGNADRVALIIINLGTGDALCAPNANPSSTLGIKIGGNGGSIVSDVTKDFTLPSRSWSAIVPSGGPNTLYVLEIVRIPGPFKPGVPVR